MSPRSRLRGGQVTAPATTMTPGSTPPAELVTTPAERGLTASPAAPPWATGRPPRTGLAWLAGAMAALAVLAAAAAAVSWDAQFVMIARARHAPAIAALEAGIPDVGAAVFA